MNLPNALPARPPSDLSDPRRRSLAFATMLFVFFCFASMDTTAKWLVTAAVPALQVAFLRYAVHFAWVLVLYLPRDGWQLAHSENPGLQALRSLLLVSGTALNFTALQYLPLTMTTAIFFAAPVLVCLLSIPVLGEQVGLRRFLAVLAGFAGVMIIVRPGGTGFDWHVVYALGALLCASGYFVLSRRVAGIDAVSVTQFYTAGAGVLVLLVPAAVVWHWPTEPFVWGLLLMLGSLGMLGHSLLTNAHRHAEASALAPTVYSQILYVALLSWLVFDQTPDACTLAGTLIIVASGLYIWHRERRLTTQPDPSA